MDVAATSRFVRLPPRKAFDLVRGMRGMSAADALNLTAFSPRKAAFEIGKTLRSAIANAENNAKLSAETLLVKEAVIEEGPRLKRFWPRARGSAGPVQKRTCHIRVVLTDGKSEGQEA
jgi:large subunit ribosomal protein L22